MQNTGNNSTFVCTKTHHLRARVVEKKGGGVPNRLSHAWLVAALIAFVAAFITHVALVTSVAIVTGTRVAAAFLAFVAFIALAIAFLAATLVATAFLAFVTAALVAGLTGTLVAGLTGTLVAGLTGIREQIYCVTFGVVEAVVIGPDEPERPVLLDILACQRTGTALDREVAAYVIRETRDIEDALFGPCGHDVATPILHRHLFAEDL